MVAAGAGSTAIAARVGRRPRQINRWRHEPGFRQLVAEEAEAADRACCDPDDGADSPFEDTRDGRRASGRPRRPAG